MKKFLALCALLLASAGASAASYTLTSGNYLGTLDFTVCGTGSCANYSGAMSTSITITTAAPLASNLAGVDVTAQVTAFSANDGLTSYGSSDANSHLALLIVVTDASGNVTDAAAIINRWQAGAAPHAVNDRTDFIQLNPGGQVFTGHNAFCVTLSGADACTAFGTDAASSLAISGPGALFALLNVTGAPTLGEWALILLAALMAAAAARRLRRNDNIARI
jgi:hypothetical protein